MKIIAVGAHADDIELGCGGALSKWAKEGHQLTLLVLSPSGYADPSGKVIRDSALAQDEAKKAAKALGAQLLQEKFETFHLEFNEDLNSRINHHLRAVQPDLMLTHWVGDSHHDHRAVALATLHAGKHCRKILSYRSNWYTGTEVFDPTYFSDITGHLEKKVELLKIFESEMSRTLGLWERWVRAQAVTEGLKAGCEHAEAFQIVKWVE